MKLFNLLIFIFFLLLAPLKANEDFNQWLISYKEYAASKGISKKTINIAFKNVIFLEQVIKYDRKQPEFFEDTITYVSKRANITRVKNAKKLLKKKYKFV